MEKKIRFVDANLIEQAVKKLFLKAGKSPTKDMLDALKKAENDETQQTAKKVISQLLENKTVSDKLDMPYCQDTGMAVVFIDIGDNVIISGDIDEAINLGVKNAYDQGFFRKSVLDPLLRINTNDNTPAVIHKNIIPGDKIKISVMAKGFGSENMSRLKMLKPSDGVDGIKKFVKKSVLKAGGCPCPPVILGIGIGGTMEKAAMMAKKQLLRPVNDKNSDIRLAKMEQDILNMVNSLGIGAMGFKGDTYCLGVKIETFPTHLAGLPVAINVNCHASRHESMEV